MALVLGAAGIIYSKVIVPFTEFSATPSDETFATDIDSILVEGDDTGRENVEQELQLVSAQYDLKRIDTSNLRWNESPARDPFSLHSNLKDRDIEAVQDKVVTNKDQIPVSGKSGRTPGWVVPGVSAIVSSAQKSFAVVDGEIVRSGDVVGGFRIGDIQNTSVRLLHIGSGRSMNIKVPK